MDRLTEQILELAPTGIVCLEGDHIRYANLSAAEMIGCATPDDLIGQPIRSYLPFVEPGSNGEDICLREDGTRFPVEYQSAPMLDDVGRAAGFVLTLRDVSRRRAAERLREELISVVSHELRTPLTAIRSVLGLLVSGHLNQETDTGRRMLDVAVSNTDRLIRLINDMLDLERVDAGEVRMSFETCDAGELMLHAADSVRAVAEAANVTIDVGTIDACVTADADRLLQVLINLLANAIKFSPSDGGTVWLDVEQSPGELVFRVRDEGRGIPADKLESIFDRFAQVDDADSRQKGGTGLGLAICRAIVKQHGGHIWAESTLGAGTTLFVALPSPEDSVYLDIERAA